MKDPEQFEIYDKAFGEILSDDSRLVEIASGMQFTEGPVWVERRGGPSRDAEGGLGPCLIFSDIPADEMKVWSPGGPEGSAGRAAGPPGTLATFRRPSGHANGNTLDRQGRLVTCEHGNRRLSRTEPDGRVVCLTESFNGKPLNSPNDVVVKSDGTIWFTDPPYGIRPEQVEQPHNYVFRLDPDGGDPTPVAGDFDRPNGLCFSPDEKRLYVADSSSRRHVRIFEVTDDNALRGGQVLATIDPGVPDGIRVDVAGRLFSTAGDGVWVVTADGILLGKILVPQTPANCTFGGPGRQTLYITARQSVYAIELATAGAQRP
jgi:gluconolactonase